MVCLKYFQYYTNINSANRIDDGQFVITFSEY